MKGYFLDRVPFFKWIRKYNVKENLAKDMIAGLTIGVLQIPQGMAYSLMAGLPPVIGLYVSFWAVIVYAFLGTAKHLSTGTYAITSLMINSCIEKLEGKYYSSGNMYRNATTEITNSTINSSMLDVFKIFLHRFYKLKK
jgi:MFS superfamily sulfate permease-like transporter